MILVQLALLVAWFLWPARAQRERAVSAVSALVAVPLVLFSAVIVLMRSVVESWTGVAITIPLVVALAAANLLAHRSLRSVRHRHAWEVRRIDAALRADSSRQRGEEDGDGPVAALGRAVTRMEDRSRAALRRDGARVLDALEDRGLIAPAATQAAAELPVGRWHELDR